MHSFLTCIFIFLSLSTFGQVKMEVETRAKVENVPQKAVYFLSEAFSEAKVRWYQEGTLVMTSYEAKFKHDKKRYSIEFDPNGNLEDVEILIHKKRIPEATANRLDEQLKTSSQAYKITRAQEQFSGSEEAILAWLKSGQIHSHITKKYELEIKVKDDNKWRMYEYTIDEKGQILSEKRIITPTSDHLVY